MKKISIILWALATVLLLPSCSGGNGDNPDLNPPGESASIALTPQSPLIGEAVSFSIENPDSRSTSVLWMFGDSASKTAPASQAVSHIYTTSGTYTVKAVVSITGAAMAELSKTVIVSENDAVITLDNDYPARMEKIHAWLNNVADVTAVSWDFGDDSAPQKATSTAEKVTHQYEKDGDYTVTATMSFGSGADRSVSKVLTVKGRGLGYSCENFDHSKMWIMAHRGNYKKGYDYPPNSISAFRKCRELGCVDIIETDVQMTKDGKVVLLHDNYMKRFTDYGSYASDNGYLKDFTLEELSKYRLLTTDGKVSDQPIPTLEEVLMEFRGDFFFNLDKCGADDVDISAVYDIVKKCGCLDRVMFYVAGNADKAKWLQDQEVPGIILPHANNASALDKMTAYSPYYLIQTSTTIIIATPSWISTVNAKGISQSQLLDDYGDAFYHYGDTSQLDSFIANGLRVVQCDYPKELDTYLASKGKR